ncbi:MAG: hypothetical protein GY754_16095 [bacterium]|nr:hypothetical protein [bacterium]
MKKSLLSLITITILLTLIPGCKTIQSLTADKDPTGKAYKYPETYNIKLQAYDSHINDPSKDRRSYYKVYIDKVEEGRTTTGLESQEKTFKGKYSLNKHLIRVEKWVIDKKAGRYKKLNNIEQPKPNFAYFTIPKDRVILIKLEAGKRGKSKFDVSFEIDE